MPSPSLPAGWAHIAHFEVDSTNAEAQRLIATDEMGPVWITAERQSAGRGRSGRAWSTDAGNLAASLLFAPQCPPQCLPELALVAGIAVHDTIVALLSPEQAQAVQLKWPNDVMIGRSKLSGILIESTMRGDRALVVMGMGINVISAPEISGRAVAALADMPGYVADFERLHTTLATHLASELDIWSNGRGFADTRQRWLTRATPAGTAISVNTGAGPVHGQFAGLDPAGALLLDGSDGKRRTFTYGDVALVLSTC